MTAWMDDANCRNPLWPSLHIDSQRAQCRSCPVADECLALATSIIREADPTTRRDLMGDARPDVWAGHTFAEIGRAS